VSNLLFVRKCATMDDGKIPCLLCNQLFRHKEELQDHMQSNYSLTINSIECVADLSRYLKYWKDRLTIDNFKDLLPFDHQIELYVLGRDNEDDCNLREKLKKDTLLAALAQQERERMDSERMLSCLFCKKLSTSKRKELLNHMNEEHAFNLGLPDNLVYVDQFLTILKYKLERFICLYCERTFRDSTTLKDHMRKKRHRKINANNKEYDKFYIINYLDPGKGWKNIQEEENRQDDNDTDNSDEEWSDESIDQAANASCLFCDLTSQVNDVVVHLNDFHNFNISGLVKQFGLNIYEQIKLINYLRLKKNENKCGFCGCQCASVEEFSTHVNGAHLCFNSEIKEIQLPAKEHWNLSLFLFPVIEDDPLLCILEDESTDCSPL
ncbi:Zinc finger protein 277, partial [Trichoplax sp. H2]